MLNLLMNQLKNNLLTLPDSVLVKIDKLNDKSNEIYGFPMNSIKDNMDELRKNGEVKVGCRSSCGVTDKTMKDKYLWNKVVDLLSKNGIKFKTEKLKSDNAWATLSGGFWNETKYTIIDNADTETETDNVKVNTDIENYTTQQYQDSTNKTVDNKTVDTTKTVFYSLTTSNNKYEVKSYIEIPKAGRNYGGSNVVEYKGKQYFNIPYHYWVTKKQLDFIIANYDSIHVFMYSKY